MNINDELGSLEIWKNKRCVDCKRTPKECRLGIEGVIHHGSELKCIDRKECERIKRNKKTR